MPDISQTLIDQVVTARQEKSALNIVGGASKSFMGRAPDEGRKVVPLSTREHTGIVDYQPVELVVTARAGTPLQELMAELDEQGQMLACEPPAFSEHSDGQATLGGTLACNLSGPARPWAGSIRDHVLGLRLINGKGEHLRFGGQVMKNVAGYDVARLQAGAMGTLGVITEISLKVMPKPSASVTLVSEMTAQEAISQMKRLSGQAVPLTGACWLDGKMYLRLAGAQSAVSETAAKWQGSALEPDDTFWHDLRDHKLSYFSDNLPLWRFSIRSSAEHWHDEGDWLIDWAGSQRWLKGDQGQKNQEELAEKAGGTASLFRSGNRNGEVFHSPAQGLMALQKKVKQSFDPVFLFNPGRLYSWM